MINDESDVNQRLVDLTILPGQTPGEDPKRWLDRMSIGKFNLPGFPRRGIFNRGELPDRWENYKCYTDIIRMKEQEYSVPNNWGGKLLGILPCKVPLMEETFRKSIEWAQKLKFKENPLIDDSLTANRLDDLHFDWVLDRTMNNSLVNHILANLAYKGHARGGPLAMNSLRSDLSGQYGVDNLNIGLIINLTATPRYTDSQLLRTWGIENRQIIVRGGGAVPSPKVVWEFLETMRVAGKQLPSGSLILVHCTHGVNRTGFFLGLWMILACNMGVDQFVHMFEERRGHTMDRPELVELLRRYEIHLRSIPCHITDPLMDIIPRMWTQIANLYIHQDKHLEMIHPSSMESYLRLGRNNNFWKVYSVVIGPLPVIFKYYMVNFRCTLNRLMRVFNGRIEAIQIIDGTNNIHVELSVSWPSYTNESYFDFIFDSADSDLTPLRPYLDGSDQLENLGDQSLTESFDVVNLMAVLSLLSWNVTETIPEEERAYDFHYEGAFVARNFREQVARGTSHIPQMGFNDKIKIILQESKDICASCNRQQDDKSVAISTTTNAEDNSPMFNGNDYQQGLELPPTIPILIQIVKGLKNSDSDLSVDRQRPDEGQHWYTVASKVRHAQLYRRGLPHIDVLNYTLVHYQGHTLNK